MTIWLYYFCPHFDGLRYKEPKTKDLNLLSSIQRAHQHIKLFTNNLPINNQKLDLKSVTEESNDTRCLRWVLSLIN